MHSPATGTSEAPRRRVKWMVFGVSFFLSLLMAEAGCRVFTYLGDRRVAAAFQQIDQPRPMPNGEVQLGQFVRRSANERVIYEIIPNMTGVTFKGASLSTDSHGCRGPERPIDKPRGALRIVAIGDSNAFGWGVEEPETMLRRLETKLREELPERQVDLINMSVPGYNTVMEVALLEHKGLALQPDVVIIDYCGNDTDLPDMIWRERDYWTLRNSYAWDIVKCAIRGTNDAWRSNAFDAAPRTEDGKRYENSPDRVPAMYRDMVGWGAWRRAVERLVELGRRHDFRVLMTSHHTVPLEVKDACRDLGIPFFIAYPFVVAYMKDNGITDYRRSPLTRSPQDPHPTSLHHRIQFESLWGFMRDNGLLQQWLKPLK